MGVQPLVSVRSPSWCSWRSGGTRFVPFKNKRLSRRRAYGNLELRCSFPRPPILPALCRLVSRGGLRPGTDGEAGARWCCGVTGSNPGGRRRTRSSAVGLGRVVGEGGLGPGCRWPRGTGPQRLLAERPGNRPCGRRGARTPQGAVACGCRLRSGEDGWLETGRKPGESGEKAVWLFFYQNVSRFPDPCYRRRFLAWASATVVCRCLFFSA